MCLVQDWLARRVNLLFGETARGRLRPDVLTVVDQLIVTILQCNIVLIVSQVLRLERVYTFVVSEVVQLMLVLYTNFLLASLFFLVVRGSGQALQSSLFLDASVIYVPVLTAPA